jgi:hypothetical protein
MQRRREGWILGGLILVFVAGTTLIGQRRMEADRAQQPSTHSVGAGGMKALLDLYARTGFRSERWEKPLRKLPRDAGLLVLAEPFARPLAADEVAHLQEWLDGGGALLLIPSAELSDISETGLSFDEAAAELDAPKSSPIAPKPGAPFTADVASLHAEGGTRLKVLKPSRVKVIARDDSGPVALTWPEKEGRVVMAAKSLAPVNGRLDAADNAVFFVNVAQSTTSRTRPRVLFDEFHQGFGIERGEGRTVWQAVGPATRALTWYGLVGLLVFLVSANRRFGSARELCAPEYRPSTEYIASMAGLYRRAAAGDIALETIFHAFVRDLGSRVDAPPDATRERLAALASQRLGLDAASLQALMARCDARIAREEAGPRRSSKAEEAELLELARQIRSFRSRAGLQRLAG